MEISNALEASAREKGNPRDSGLRVQICRVSTSLDGEL